MPRHAVPLIVATILLMRAAPVVRAQPWSANWVTQAERWKQAGAGAIQIGPGGIRLEVGKDWVGAYAEPVVLPAGAGKVRLTVRLGGGARLTIQIVGDLHGDGKTRLYSPAWGADLQGTYERPLDPRAIAPSLRKPVKLVFAAEGPAKAWAEVSAVDFVPVQWPPSPQIPGQKNIRGVDLMPSLPQPYRMLDWKKICRDFDAIAFDTKRTDEHLPLCIVSPVRDALGRPFFSQSTYVSDDRARTGAGESINSLWAIVSATVSGIDKRKQHGVDWVAMADAWFCTAKGLNLLTDYRGGPTPLNYWYDLQPTTAYAMLVDLYPNRREADRILRASVDTLARVHDSLKGADGIPNYDFSGYDYERKAPATTGSKEPDNAGLAAWIFYMAYRHFGDRAYLTRAQKCVRFWDRYGAPPFIETGLPFGALTAARMNAELGLKLPADKYIQRCFEFSHEGADHTTVGVDRWGDMDVCGLWHDPAAKAYLVESAQWTMLVNVARYDPGYARAMGKWMLNLANSARLFYPGELPPDSQSDWFWKGDPAHCIPYERINWGRKSKWVYAGSDASDYGWPVLDLSLYSGASAGLIAGRIDATNVPGILRIDLLAFDTFRDRAYPTYLFYNPHASPKAVELKIGPRPVDVYDTVGKRFLVRRVRGTAHVAIPSDRAIVAVLTPAGGRVTRAKGRLLVNGIVVDYAAGR
jgi:hypothetical protein